MSINKWTDRDVFHNFNNVLENFFKGENRLLDMALKGSRLLMANASATKDGFLIATVVHGSTIDNFTVSLDDYKF